MFCLSLLGSTGGERKERGGVTFGSLGMEVEKRGSGGKDKKEEDGDRSLSRRRNEKRRSLLSFQIDKKNAKKEGGELLLLLGSGQVARFAESFSSLFIE